MAKTKHSKMFEKIKEWYHTPNCWTSSMVANAVKKGKITPEEYQEIVGEEYKEV